MLVGVQASFKSGNVVGQTYKIALGYASNNFAKQALLFKTRLTNAQLAELPTAMTWKKYEFTDAKWAEMKAKIEVTSRSPN
jgi:hypothetical protein